MGSPPLEPARGAAAEEDGGIRGRELVVLEQEPSLQALALDVRVLLVAQTRERVLLGRALRPPADLGSGVRIRAGGEPFEAEPRTSVVTAAAAAPTSTTTHTESNAATAEGIAESHVEVAADASTASRREPDVRSARAADVVSFRFNLRGSRAVREESLNGASTAEAGKHVCDLSRGQAAIDGRQTRQSRLLLCYC